MRYWIYDEEEGPQGFPLQRLICRVRASFGDSGIMCEVEKARGYGGRIAAWEQVLENASSVTVPLSDLDEIASARKEWFYDLDVRIANGDLRFGVHDSTALFVQSEGDVAFRIASQFQRYRPAISS